MWPPLSTVDQPDYWHYIRIRICTQQANWQEMSELFSVIEFLNWIHVSLQDLILPGKQGEAAVCR